MVTRAEGLLIDTNDLERGIIAIKALSLISEAESVFSIRVSNEVFEKLTSRLRIKFDLVNFGYNGQVIDAIGRLLLDGESLQFVYYESMLYVFNNLYSNQIIELLNEIRDELSSQNLESIQLRFPIETPFGIVMKSTWVSAKDISKDIYPDVFKFSVDQHGNPFDPFKIGLEWKNQGNLMILHGEPGTGKSKSVIYVGLGLGQSSGKTVRVVVVTPGVIERLGDMVLNAIDENDLYLFVIDDFDKLSGRFVRGENKEVSDLISLLLQMTDGILPIDNIKFLITSNRRIDEIDEALLRPGRLFRRIELRLRSYRSVAKNVPVPKPIKAEFKKYFGKPFRKTDKLTLAEWKFLLDRIPELKTVL